MKFPTSTLNTQVVILGAVSIANAICTGGTYGVGTEVQNSDGTLSCKPSSTMKLRFLLFFVSTYVIA